MIPGKSSSSWWSMRRKLLRISSLTGRDFQPLLRRSWRVVGRAPADISDPSTRDSAGATAPGAGSLPFIVEERVESPPSRHVGPGPEQVLRGSASIPDGLVSGQGRQRTRRDRDDRDKGLETERSL